MASSSIIRPCEEMSKVEGDLKAGQKWPGCECRGFSLRIQPKCNKQESSRAPPAVPGPGGSQNLPPAHPGSCPDGPARAYLGTHPRRDASPPPTPVAGARLGPAPPPPRRPAGGALAASSGPAKQRGGAPAATRSGSAGLRELATGRAPAGGAGTAPPRCLPLPSRLPGSAPGGNDVLLPG